MGRKLKTVYQCRIIDDVKSEYPMVTFEENKGSIFINVPSKANNTGDIVKGSKLAVFCGDVIDDLLYGDGKQKIMFGVATDAKHVDGHYYEECFDDMDCDVECFDGMDTIVQFTIHDKTSLQNIHKRFLPSKLNEMYLYAPTSHILDKENVIEEDFEEEDDNDEDDENDYNTENVFINKVGDFYCVHFDDNGDCPKDYIMAVYDDEMYCILFRDDLMNEETIIIGKFKIPKWFKKWILENV